MKKSVSHVVPTSALTTACTAALAAILAVGVGVTAAAQGLSQIYQDWRSGPVQVLMLPEEEKAWQQISTDAEAETFIRLFWARRDPTPGTELNEFRREFEQRAAYAQQEFTTEDTPGALSDRGRTFILLGAPRRVQRPGAGGAVEGSGGIGGDDPFSTSGSIASGTGGPGRGGGVDRTGVASEERWIYEGDHIPPFVDVKRFTVRFLSEPGTEEVDIRASEQALGYMGEARHAAVVNPDLTAADLAASGPSSAAAEPGEATAWMGDAVSDGDTALDALQRAFADGGGASGGGTVSAALDAGAFQASDGRWIIPYQISTSNPPSGGPAEVVGELVDDSGSRVLAFRLQQDWSESKGQSYVKDTLVVPPGSYELHAALEGPGGVLRWTGSEAVEVPARSDDFWLSELVLSDNIYPMTEAQEMLEPYAWQGIVVVPKGEPSFPQNSLMWFYLHACNPLLDDAGEPALRVTVKIEGPSQTRATVPVEPAVAGDRCWVLAQGVDLAANRFPPGDYTIQVLVRDTEAGKTLFREADFSVVQ